MKHLVMACVLTACATTQGDERGLVELRRQLALDAPAGHVVGDQLVHADSGLSLLRVPATGWQVAALDAAGDDRWWFTAEGVRAVPFEGTPGMVLMFRGAEARLVRMSGPAAEWVPVLEPFPTDTHEVMDVRFESDTPRPQETTVSLDVPRGRVSATKVGGQLTIDFGPGAQPPLVLGARHPDGDCGGGFDVSIVRGTSSDGATWFQCTSNVVSHVHPDCTDALRTYTDTVVEGGERRHRAQAVWLRFPADGSPARIVGNASSEGAISIDHDEGLSARSSYKSWHTFALVGGSLELLIEGGTSFGGERWTWTLVSDRGESFDLAPHTPFAREPKIDRSTWIP